MPNFLQQYRMPNFFSGQPETGQMPSYPYKGLLQPRPLTPRPPPPQQQSNIGLMNPETPALDKYNAHLSNAPNREDHQLGLLGKILSGVAGGVAGMQGGVGAGYSTTRGLLDSKYDRARGDYERSGQNLGLLAQIESSNIDRGRESASDFAKYEREGEANTRAWLDLARKNRLTAAQISKIGDDMSEVGHSDYTDPKTGKKMRWYEDGRTIEIGQAQPSAEDTEAQRQLERRQALEDKNAAASHTAGLRVETPKSDLTPGQYEDALQIAMFEVARDNPDLQHVTDDEGMYNEVNNSWFGDDVTQEQIDRHKGLVNTNMSTKGWGSDAGSKGFQVNLPADSPINPGSDLSVETNDVTREDIIAAIKKERPGEEITEDYIKEIAAANGIDYNTLKVTPSIYDPAIYTPRR